MRARRSPRGSAGPRHPGPVLPFLHGGSRVVVDGAPICAECGLAVEPTGPGRWRHVPRGRRPARRSRWLFPTLADLRACATYRELAARYPWASRTTEEQWREAVARLARYHELLAASRRVRTLGARDNPYLELVELLAAPSPAEPEEPRYWGLPLGLAQLLDLSERRRELVDLFAWAIPNERALEALARHAPLVEAGAGTGYWLALLQALGVDAVGYDLSPAGTGAPNEFHRRARRAWTEVRQGSAVVAARRHPERTLLVCWPPYDDDAASYQPLRAYRGEIVVHLGEREGASGSVRFHRELALNWTPVEEVELPHWPGLDDRLTVYRRNPVRRRHSLRDRCPECGRLVPTGSIGRCDACFAARPPALALRAGRHRVEYTAEVVGTLPPPLRAAFERSAHRIV